MLVHRTIGISLAFLVISAGAMAKMPEKSLRHDATEPLGGKPGKGDIRLARTYQDCGSARRSTGQNTRMRSRHISQPVAVATDSYTAGVQTAGRSETGKAAWYGLVGNYTSSGERLDMVTPTAAHRSLPLASYAKVTNLDSGRSVIVKINDRGPQSRRFIIDLSPRAAEEIDMKRVGVAAVVVEPVVLRPALAAWPASNVAAFQSSATPVAQ